MYVVIADNRFQLTLKQEQIGAKLCASICERSGTVARQQRVMRAAARHIFSRIRTLNLW
jgi:hypothetical protein